MTNDLPQEKLDPKAEQSDLDAAFSAFHEALSIAEELEAKDLIAQLHQALSEAYELKGDLSGAYQHYKKFHEAEKQVFNQESDKKLKNLQVIHQVEQTKRESELQKAKADQLAELDKIKTRFFANLSHEFRTPLTLLIAPLQDQLENPEKDILRPKAEVMLRSATRLLSLINELLDLSKLEDGKLKLRISEGDIIFFLNGIFHSFESLGDQKNIKLLFETEVPELMAFFDRDKLEKIFSNLCSNAFKFTQEGEVKVILNLKKHHNNQPLILVITISDSGTGIPKEQLSTIFDRFYQIENSYTRRYQGTGIGLALVKELVELHHGRIEVQSEVGKGTSFTIELPISKEVYRVDDFTSLDNEPYSVPSGVKKRFDQFEKSDGKQRKPKLSKAINKVPNSLLVLIIEDNPDVREYIAEQLNPFYDIALAENGSIGISKAKELTPDLIISDVMMPEKNGYEVCAELKNDIATNHIPLVLLTAKGSIDSKVKGFDIGADEYLTKPFNSRELISRVKNLIEQRKRVQNHFQSTLSVVGSVTAEATTLNPFVEQATKVLEKQIGNEGYSIEQFAYDLFLSRSQLHRKFVALTGKSPSDFIRSVRLKFAAEMILKGEKTISQIAFEIGFGSNKSYFAKCFKEQFGRLPSEFSEK